LNLKSLSRYYQMGGSTVLNHARGSPLSHGFLHPILLMTHVGEGAFELERLCSCGEPKGSSQIKAVD
jgi:hypothetical protein